MGLLDELEKKEVDKEKLVKKVIRNPELINHLFEGLNQKKGTVKFGCEKILRLTSEKRPDLLYSYFDDIVILIDSKNSFIKWGALITISNLVSVDVECKFEKIFERYFAGITQNNMVSAANIVGHSWKIAKAKPELAEKIVDKILEVERARYERKGEISPECNRVVCGSAIDSFDAFFDVIRNKTPVIEFVKRQLGNSRAPVVRKAKKFLKKHNVT